MCGIIATAGGTWTNRVSYTARDVSTLRRLEWDYTALADAYLARPGYAEAALDRIAEVTGLPPHAPVLDAGAGAGHLTLQLARRGWDVLALEPNPAMRAHGERRTRSLPNVRWADGLMEDTGLPAGRFSACTFGSSFGVADYTATLRESARVLADGGWFACLFNRRAFDDPLQAEIEAFVKSELPDFAYGPRRADQAPIVAAPGLFEPAVKIEARFVHTTPAQDWVEAWRSHGTLHRQAGLRFTEIIEGIGAIVARSGSATLQVPYVTEAWVARRRPGPRPSP
jgi:SAM-dependent methyltransferase